MSLRIFIDSGHGGRDSGATANGMRESDIVLDVSRHLAPILEKEGHKVQLSRTADVDTPITQRWQAANSWNADLFVSIHTNAGGGTGVETLIPTASPNNPSRDLQTNRRFAEIVSNTLASIFRMRVRRTNGVMLETETRHDFIGVLRNTRMLAVMPEIAFIDSPLSNPDVDILRNRRQEVAQGIANGISQFLRTEGEAYMEEREVRINGVSHMIPGVLINDRNLTGTRALAELLGADVTNDGSIAVIEAPWLRNNSAENTGISEIADNLTLLAEELRQMA